MTVQELRKKLADLPDDWPIEISYHQRDVWDDPLELLLTEVISGRWWERDHFESKMVLIVSQPDTPEVRERERAYQEERRKRREARAERARELLELEARVERVGWAHFQEIEALATGPVRAPFTPHVDYIASGLEALDEARKER